MRYEGLYPDPCICVYLAFFFNDGNYFGGISLFSPIEEGLCSVIFIVICQGLLTLVLYMPYITVNWDGYFLDSICMLQENHF